MPFLVDANVLSEPTKPEPEPRVVEWLSRHERALSIDPFILGELRFGILIMPRGRRRTRMEAWFEASIVRMPCHPWDQAVGLRWAELIAELRERGRAMPAHDSYIAATALHHGLVLVTRNHRHFEHAGIDLLDPFGGDD